jgi:hypothetical protein
VAIRTAITRLGARGSPMRGIAAGLASRGAIGAGAGGAPLADAHAARPKTAHRICAATRERAYVFACVPRRKIRSAPASRASRWRPRIRVVGAEMSCQCGSLVASLPSGGGMLAMLELGRAKEERRCGAGLIEW